jgi:hypothetical protein
MTNKQTDKTSPDIVWGSTFSERINLKNSNRPAIRITAQKTKKVHGPTKIMLITAAAKSTAVMDR